MYEQPTLLGIERKETALTLTGFRRASLQDVPDLVKLLGILFAQEKEFEPNAVAQAAGLESILHDPELGAIAVANDGEECVGMVVLLYTVSTALGGRVGLLEDMVVSTSARGRGIGDGLLSYVLRIAEEEGCKRVTLLTDDDNVRAHRFYERAGFSRSAMIPFRILVS